MSLKRNVVANYLGQGWRALMGLLFVPIYIKYLGIEAYGLIGLFAILQAWLTLLDMGMRPALGREMARFVAGARSAQSTRDLLRSIEVIALIIAVAIVAAVWASSSWLASHWIKPDHLSVDAAARAFSVMGFVTALRFIEGIYGSSMVGLQRQVLENVLTSCLATLRGFGAVGVLAFISPTIEAFFVWQGLVSIVTVVFYITFVYQTLPAGVRPARYSAQALAEVRRFAAGMMSITLLSLMLTQFDKILLSRLLDLESFAHYALAGVIANALFMLIWPIAGALSPRLVVLAAAADQPGLCRVYHKASQLVTVLVGSTAAILIVFSEQVLRGWTHDPALARAVAPIMQLLVLGTLLNGLMYIPYQLQLSHGWTELTIKINVVAVILLVPAIILVVPRYGAMGAATVWVSLNLGYLLLAVYFIHRRLLPQEKWRWYREDVAVPLGAAFAIAYVARYVLPLGFGYLAQVGVVAICLAFSMFGSAMAARTVREQLFRSFRRIVQKPAIS